MVTIRFVESPKSPQATQDCETYDLKIYEDLHEWNQNHHDSPVLSRGRDSTDDNFFQVHLVQIPSANFLLLFEAILAQERCSLSMFSSSTGSSRHFDQYKNQPPMLGIYQSAPLSVYRNKCSSQKYSK